jgi:hypothetical protein
MTNNGRYPDYPLFKGLQRPLELMGLQGRYIYWAAGVAGGAIVGFIAAYCLMGFVARLGVQHTHTVCIFHRKIDILKDMLALAARTERID